MDGDSSNDGRDEFTWIGMRRVCKENDQDDVDGMKQENDSKDMAMIFREEDQDGRLNGVYGDQLMQIGRLSSVRRELSNHYLYWAHILNVSVFKLSTSYFSSISDQLHSFYSRQ